MNRVMMKYRETLLTWGTNGHGDYIVGIATATSFIGDEVVISVRR